MDELKIKKFDERPIKIAVLARALMYAARMLMIHGYHVDGIREPEDLCRWLYREGERQLQSQLRQLCQQKKEHPREL